MLMNPPSGRMPVHERSKIEHTTVLNDVLDGRIQLPEGEWDEEESKLLPIEEDILGEL